MQREDGISEISAARQWCRAFCRAALVLLLAGLHACAPLNNGMPGKGVHDGPAGLPPLSGFFREPRTKAFTLSPDGTHIAWLAPWNGRMNLHVAAVAEDLPPDSLMDTPAAARGRRITRISISDIHSCHWIRNDALLFLTDPGGDGNLSLYMVPRDGGVVRSLTPFAGVRADVVDMLPERPDEILIAMNQRDPTLYDAYRLSVRSGRMQRVAENPGGVDRWMADHDGRVRAAVQSDGLRTVILYRETEAEPFRPVLSVDADTRVDLHGFTFDNRHLILVSNQGRDKAALEVFDPEGGAVVQTLATHPEVDVLAPMLSRQRRRIEGAVFISDRIGYLFFDEFRRRAQAAIDRHFPGCEARIAERSRDEHRMLVLVSGARCPGAYYVYDAEADRMAKVADLRPWLDGIRLAEMRSVAYTARDGRRIHGYLTLPAEEAAGPQPMVVLPHGDPWTRDVWGYHPEAQFFASRGYAVFQPNFRGSSGYGRAFQTAGYRQWGTGVMQHDITDGVAWLVSQGIADPGRIAIYGVSYGGYAALAGLAFTPDRYAAGISLSGPANLLSLISGVPAYQHVVRERLYREIGDPRQDPGSLIAASPFFHADRIRTPLFLAQGATDPRVKRSEIDAMVLRLRRRRVPVAYMVRSGEGHVFRKPANRLDFYEAVEAFLARHLGGRSAAPAAVLAPLMSGGTAR